MSPHDPAWERSPAEVLNAAQDEAVKLLEEARREARWHEERAKSLELEVERARARRRQVEAALQQFATSISYMDSDLVETLSRALTGGDVIPAPEVERSRRDPRWRFIITTEQRRRLGEEAAMLLTEYMTELQRRSSVACRAARDLLGALSQADLDQLQQVGPAAWQKYLHLRDVMGGLDAKGPRKGKWRR